MRKLIVTAIVSLDGYFEGKDFDVMALPMGDAFDDHNLERLQAASTLLLGRKTYTDFLSFWPGVAADEEAPEVLRAISRINNSIEKVVVSDTLTSAAPWGDTEVVARADARKRIEQLKAEEGGDIIMFGSRTLWHDLLAAGLVDEIHLMYGPVVLGEGTPMFEAGTVSFKLLGLRSFEGSENFVVQYAVVPQSQTT